MKKKNIFISCILMIINVAFAGCYNDIISITKDNYLRKTAVLLTSFTQTQPNQNLQQPTENRKAYGIVDPSYAQNFPPLADIISKPAQDVPVYGLFTWMGGSDLQWNNVFDVGFSNLRIGGAEWVTRTESWAMPAVDSIFTRMANSTIVPMYGLIGKNRAKFGTNPLDTAQDQAFIDSYISDLNILMVKYAPNGTYWTSHADPAFRPGGVKYKPIKSVEIWNEPNLHYLVGADNWNMLTEAQKQDLYARLLIASYNHVKSNPSHPEWKTVKIVGMAACGVSNMGPAFIRGVHEKLVAHGGHAQYYDVLSWHPYTHDFGPDTEAIIINNTTGNINYHYSLVNDQAAIRSIMQEYGNGNKPVWFTEVGWARPNGVFAPNNCPVNEYMEAAYVSRLYLMAMRLGVEQVHVMFVIDADNFNAGFFDYNNNYSWYKQAYATNFMIQLMPKPKIISAISDGANGYYAYRINPNADDAAAKTVIAAWNVKNPLVVNIPCTMGDSYTVYNMLGSVIETNTAGSSSISVTIGPYPVYIIIE